MSRSRRTVRPPKCICGLLKVRYDGLTNHGKPVYECPVLGRSQDHNDILRNFKRRRTEVRHLIEED